MLLVLRFLSKRLSAFCKWRSSASRFPCVWAGWPRHEVFLLWQHHRGAVSAEPVASRRQVHHQRGTGTARCVQSLQRTPMPKPLPLQARRHGNGKEQWKRVLAQAASGGSTATSTGGTTAASTTAPSAATTASSATASAASATSVPLRMAAAAFADRQRKQFRFIPSQAERLVEETWGYGRRVTTWGKRCRLRRQRGGWQSCRRARCGQSV